MGGFEGKLWLWGKCLFGFFESFLQGFDGLSRGGELGIGREREWQVASQYLSVCSLVIGREIARGILDLTGESRDAGQTVVCGV